METFLSKYQSGFCKRLGAQHSLLGMLEKWNRTVNQSKVFCTLLTDLSKTFDCFRNEVSNYWNLAYLEIRRMNDHRPNVPVPCITINCYKLL